MQIWEGQLKKKHKLIKIIWKKEKANCRQMAKRMPRSPREGMMTGMPQLRDLVSISLILQLVAESRRSEVSIWKASLAATVGHVWSHPTQTNDGTSQIDHEPGTPHPTLFENWYGITILIVKRKGLKNILIQGMNGGVNRKQDESKKDFGKGVTPRRTNVLHLTTQEDGHGFYTFPDPIEVVNVL